MFKIFDFSMCNNISFTLFRSSHRDGFSKNICSFFPEATFLQFSRRVDLFVEQTCFFKKGLFFLFVEQTLLSQRTDTNFLRNPHLVLEHIYDSDEFSRSLYFLIEQIFIFQEALSSPRTHYFPGDPYASNR